MNVLLRVLAGVALAVSGYVHLHLAHRYGYPGTITGEQLFIAQGVTALVLAVAIVVSGNRWLWAAGAALGLASFVAVMVYRYADIGAIGPLPDMYDATWQPSPQKLLSAVAEISVPLWWVLHLMTRHLRTGDVAAREGRRGVARRRRRRDPQGGPDRGAVALLPIAPATRHGVDHGESAS
jgi:hypothetical protein